jgi:hypothetical protein
VDRKIQINSSHSWRVIGIDLFRVGRSMKMAIRVTRMKRSTTLGGSRPGEPG